MKQQNKQKQEKKSAYDNQWVSNQKHYSNEDKQHNQ